MAKKHLKLTRKEAKKRKYEKIKYQIEEMLDSGVILKSEMKKQLKISFYELNEVIKAFPELRAKWTVRRRSITDIAADNIAEIVSNKKHPRNYEASRFIVQNFKSDLDSDLDAKDDDDVSVDFGEGGDAPKRISIKFKGRKKED